MPSIYPISSALMAVKFCSEMRKTLTEHELDLVRQRNEDQSNWMVCHSHDFCDANDVLLETMEYFNLTLDASSPHQAAFLNEVWDIAKNDFKFGRIDRKILRHFAGLKEASDFIYVTEEELLDGLLGLE